ncbi:MAG: hypothetical protein MUP16_05635 [Sedimentisphaerales bacterium]|nr:hypothetical protein [Sedimentisphaerales bacterium]
MRGLKICLWIAGILCLSSIVGVFLPMSMCESIVEYFGIESLPDSPLLFYMARVTSAMAVWIGVFFIILALRPMDYGVMVPFSGLCSVALGVVCAITGFIEKMPLLWFLGDSLSCLVLGILILVFWQKAKKTGL